MLLPVKIRVFTEDRFQKAVAADAATIFLWEHAPHASNTHHFMHSAAQPICTCLLSHEYKDSPHKIQVHIGGLDYLFGSFEWSSMSTALGL
jgi:hypothetical protein